MNKKNTKKFVKRMIDNYITILPCKFTDVTFDNGELPMFTSKKPPGLGKSIIVKQFIRGKIIGKVKSLKRFKTNKYGGWTMLVAVEITDSDDLSLYDTDYYECSHCHNYSYSDMEEIADWEED